MSAPQPNARPDWRRVLDEAIAAEPSGKMGVALRLGVSRPYVSRITTGHIATASPRFVARVLALLAQVSCPYLRITLSSEQCRRYAGREYARLAAHEVRHWRACQKCPHNPAQIAAAAGLAPHQIDPGPAAEAAAAVAPEAAHTLPAAAAAAAVAAAVAAAAPLDQERTP